LSEATELEGARIQRGAAGGLSALRDLDDYALVNVAAGFADVPYAKYASTPEGLRRLIIETLAPFPRADLSFLRTEIQHEAEHGAAARALGCTTRFTFSMIPLPDGSWQALPGQQWASARMLSKLGIASIAAAPACLSVNDLSDLRSMGYRDAEDVAARIREFNSWARNPLPVPVNQK
jgi:hypothetical protein